MAVFKKPRISAAPIKKRDIPENLWTKCKRCSEIIYNKDLDANLKVCPKCNYHFTMSGRERIAALLDADTFQEMDANMVSVDELKFQGVSSYTEKLKEYQKSTGLKDAVVTGLGKLEGREVSLAVMDFSFLGASMGAVVGEKITRCIERGTEMGLPVIIVSTSGGARMYEGMFSLMQMAKTSAALAMHAVKHLPYISVLTHPTTAGVMASYASLGDVHIAEPGALIGFAGPRVIKETTQQELPGGFQTAEFLLDRGLIDMIVHRKQLKPTIAKLLEYMGPNRKAGHL